MDLEQEDVGKGGTRIVLFRLCHLDSPNFPSSKAAKAKMTNIEQANTAGVY